MSPKMIRKGLNELLSRLRHDYARSTTKKEKMGMIDLWCRVSGHERKYGIKELLGQRGPQKKAPGAAAPKRGGSRPRYGPQVIVVVKSLWKLLEQPCGKRLHAALPLWLNSWELKCGKLTPEVRKKVTEISPCQIDR